MRSAWWVLAGAALALAYGAQMGRWLRVLQREHYEAASLPRFWRRWMRTTRRPREVTNAARGSAATANAAVACTVPVALLVGLSTRVDAIFVADVVFYGVLFPQGLSFRGRTGALQWTRRLGTLAGAGVLISALGVIVGVLCGETLLAGALVVCAVPLVLAVAAWALVPYEARRAATFVVRAQKRLARVQPLIVAITGSFGKTSTKNHLADLLGGDGGVVATPKSFNNRAGLSRAINENLTDDARVFVAEMGTYGPGEIRELCAWCPPDVAVVTAIGPVHLERMKSLDVIERAKFEITEKARVVILNIDDSRLATWVARLGDRRVRTAGSLSADADVRVIDELDHWRVVVDGVDVVTMEPVVGVQTTNLACAVAAALEVGAVPTELARRLAGVRAVANRATVTTAASGVVVIDDTFNANPASARASLNVLGRCAHGGRRVVVTPGLIELGELQERENEELAREVSRRGWELAIVGRTNSAALHSGFDGDARHFTVRDAAVAWVRESLRPGDAVLYLNDLPDHYP